MPVSPPPRSGNRPDQDTRFGIYIHWPFCKAKCPYCDFNSHVRDAVDQERFAAAYVREIRHIKDHFETESATSLFFGGGTPSLMKPETVATIIDAIDREIGIDPNAEISLEANPTSVEADHFEGYARAGVNRVSLGVQSLEDRDLQFLGREHSSAEAIDAIRIARRQFRRMSFDLIYARAGQSPESWREELNRALELGTDHLSLYQLTIEPGTAFHKAYQLGTLPTMDDDRAADLFDLTAEAMQEAGFNRYEVSNHARAGEESRHNLTYWRYRPYAGIGPGAHGRMTDRKDRAARATVMARTPEDWLRRVERDGHGLARNDALDDAERAAEYLMMSLRLREGSDLDRFARLSDAPLPETAIDDLVAEGLLSRSDRRIAATQRGTPVLNAVLGHLLT